MSIDTGDTAWVLASAALVMFMTPGLALFYGGLVRAKNVLGTISQSFVALAVVSVTWVLVGYTLAFGPDVGGVVGGLRHLGLAGVGGAAGPFASTVPASSFAAFQLMFAVITPALITGAVAERMRSAGTWCSSRSGPCSSMRRSPTGCGAEGSSARRGWAPSTSQAAPSST
jgi:Amt family ammonium transporter